MVSEGKIETATLGMGCFWCAEALFMRVHGVLSVTLGYAGGQVENPTYEAVCRGDTGHIEVVQVQYDSQIVRYEELLRIFFAMHDPTSRDQQGADVGEQYRSIIFTHSREQHEAAVAYIAKLTAEKVFRDPIVTEVQPLQKVYRAEDYHYNYYAKHPRQPYCQMVIAPKLTKFEQDFHGLLGHKSDQ